MIWFTECFTTTFLHTHHSLLAQTGLMKMIYDDEVDLQEEPEGNIYIQKIMATLSLLGAADSETGRVVTTWNIMGGGERFLSGERWKQEWSVHIQELWLTFCNSDNFTTLLLTVFVIWSEKSRALPMSKWINVAIMLWRCFLTTFCGNIVATFLYLSCNMLQQLNLPTFSQLFPNVVEKLLQPYIVSWAYIYIFFFLILKIVVATKFCYTGISI